MRKSSLIILTLLFGFCLVFSGVGQAKQSAPVKFSILLRATPEFTPDNNPWVKEINKRANADITWIAASTTNIWEKRNVMMASGDYPDVIIMNVEKNTANDNLYQQMVKNNIILPLNNFLKKAPNIMKYTHKSAWDAVRDKNGKIYMVPRCTIIREDFMLIRRDWKDFLKLETPKTIEDWRNFYKAVATKDPDGNKKADTFGTTDTYELMALSGTTNIDFFARSWHADRQWYDDGKGKVFYGVFAKDGRFKSVLDFYRKLNQDKSLDPDLMINKGVNIKQERYRQGTVASVRVFAGSADSDLNVLRQIHPNAQIEFVNFATAPETSQYKKEKLILTNPGVYNAWALTNKAKGKEQAIIKVMDWMLSDEGWNVLLNGVEGVHYRREGSNLVRLEPEYGTYTRWIGHLMMFRRPNDEALWLKNVIPQIRPYQKEWLDKSVKYIGANYKTKGLLGFASDKETEFYKKDIYTRKYVETMSKIIYGALPLSAWDDFLKEVYASGWDEITNEYNEYYQKHK